MREDSFENNATSQEVNSRPQQVQDGLFIPQPQTVEQTGLDIMLLAELALKEIYSVGRATGLHISQTMALPFPVVEQVINFLRREQFCEILGSGGIGEQFYEYGLTDSGKEKVNEALARSQYRGRAPIPFESYREVVQKQSIRNSFFSREVLEKSLSHLVLDPQIFERLGPAMNSGEAIFIYGPPGNGKTSIALALTDILPGNILIPHALEANGEIIKVFDPLVHEEVSQEPDNDHRADVDSQEYKGPERRHDQRWAICKHPSIVVGGELTLDRLDMQYEVNTKIHQAPPQVKACGGIFIIDDFGRQRVQPRDLLNRWIIPLDRHVDYQTLHNGESLAFPFDIILIFATNLQPSELVDEAFLRRVRNKIVVPDPTEEQFMEIFRRVCASHALAFEEDLVKFLLATHYRPNNRFLRACHPFDLVSLVIDICRFEGDTPELTRETLNKACEIYFTQPEQ